MTCFGKRWVSQDMEDVFRAQSEDLTQSLFKEISDKTMVDQLQEIVNPMDSSYYMTMYLNN